MKIKFVVPVFPIRIEDGHDVAVTKGILICAVDDWNNSAFISDYFLQEFPKAKNIKAHLPSQNANHFYITVEFKTNKVRDNYLAKIAAWLTGQMSDGWGEGFEQQEQFINERSIYISTWRPENPVKFIVK